MEEESKQIKSKYSSGVNIIIRLDQLWKDTHQHAREGKFQNWNDDLDCIWRELARDFKGEDSYKEEKQKFDKYDKELEKLMPFGDQPPEGFEEINENDIKKRNKIYSILQEKQLFLARLENHLGKGTTEDDEDEDDFD
ncbi:MAG: hypothetical protein ACOC3V_01310 [bacterium]